jgi:serine/threonine protein kinase
LRFLTLQKEAEVMAGLDHINILKIFEVIKGKKRIYFVLDYIDRGSLLQLIKSVGVFTDDVASYVVKQSCEGLKCMAHVPLCLCLECDDLFPCLFFLFILFELTR